MSISTIDELRFNVAENPNDGIARYRLAAALVDSDPGAAIEHANDALARLPLESPALQSVVVVLADALARAKMFQEIVALVEACRERWPRFTELRYRQALAFEKLGRGSEMLAALEKCIELGEDPAGLGTAGAGTFIPYHRLGLFAEAAGDQVSARAFFARAVAFGGFAPAAERLAALAALSSPTRTSAPAPSEPAMAPNPGGSATPKTRPLTVVACIPGREFSGRFFDAWNEFAERCRAIGINLVISRRYDAVVYYARNRVAGGNVRSGPKQAPWGGELDYDYMLWIDSDVIFRFEDFQALLAHKIDMVAGLYLMADNTRYSAVEEMREETFRTHGEFDFLTPAKLASRRELLPVDYCGFGFVLVRRGVFERLEYPWFRPLYLEMGECMDFTSEDVGFCMMAKRAGIRMMIDPNVVVGHEKSVVLAPPRKAA